MASLDVAESRIYDPNTLLILTSPENATQLLWSKAQPNWVCGYALDDSFPAPEVVIELLKNEDMIGWRAFWLGLLIRYLLVEGPTELGDFIRQRLPRDWPNLERADVSAWYDLARTNISEINDLIDEADEYLERIERDLFVTYRGLETFDAAGSYVAIRALIGLWFDRLRRWRHIRAKIFLRPDLYHVGRLNFPDASKLSAYLIRLDE
ncbi:hypothetical protein [Alicyclobacillus sendaiensis]|uniref:Uncharacterized protein n=1 Tax=Alicyclobacillus sendaiensis PA2 TaxID=3029425 RepID=A0ABT6Y1S4_ALISE|nr:hypothetical protein [Alicyclobacillus sendaiensis]MDI9261165.1 hypothetical protein [Alicyclobacillus sendaiensis PA2]